MISPAPPVAESARHRTDQAEAVKQAWRAGRRPDAATALKENPELAGDRAVALDLAYEEFCVREEAGEALDSVAFCSRFPFGASLRRLLTLHRFLDDHPDALGVPANWPEAGEAVGDFLLLRELGSGSFSRVYLALETTTGGRPVALKVTAAGSREADTLGPLSHPHLIPVLSSRLVGDWTVVAMPFTGTATIEDVLSVGWPSDAVPPPRSAAVLLEAASCGSRADDPPVASPAEFPVHAGMTYADAVTAVAAGLFAAVAYLHTKNIAHRDIKPSNVLLAPNGRPYLLDFNLASSAADPWRLVGTLPYMAPEQLAALAKANSAPADARPGDVFACGVVLFELLTGRHPFSARDAQPANRDEVVATLLAAQRAGCPLVGSFNPRVRRVIRDAVQRCLALDPRERPTAAELAELFAPATPRRRPWLLVSLLAGAGALALALGSPTLRPSTPERKPAPPAPTEAPPPAVTTAPPAVSTPFERGLAQYRRKEYMSAAGEFIDAGKANNDGRAYGHAVYCLSVAGAPASSIAAAANEAIRLGHGTASVYANRAYSSFQVARLDKAKADCDEAIRLDPNLLAPRFTRAVIHLQEYRKGTPIPPEAVEDMNRVTAAAPTSPEVWTVAAQIYILTSAGTSEGRDRAAQAALNAVQRGKKPTSLKQNADLKRLAGHPLYEQALKSAPKPLVPSPSPYLANPIP
jgi:serine/threonine protein kinase